MKILVTNFKDKFTGVTTTAFTVAKSHAEHFGQDVTLVGNALGTPGLATISAKDLADDWQGIVGDGPAVLHVRRDSEMWYGLMLRDVLGKPVRLVFTSSNMVRRSWIGRWLMARMDAVIATTQAAADALPIPAAAIVPHGVDMAMFAAKPGGSKSGCKKTGPKTLACVGRVRAGKGTQNFVSAFIQVAQRRDDVHAAAFGMIKPEDSAFHQGLVAQLDQAGVSDRFEWAGEVPHQDLVARLARCHVLVTLPEYEPFGVTPLETMAMGMPAVCSKTGCFTDLIQNGENGFLVHHNDVTSAANAIDQVLDWPLGDPDFIQKMRGFVDHRYSQRAEAAGVLKVYQTLTS